MPRRRITTQKSSLPRNEVAICLRLKEARERVGLDQLEAARRVGVKVHVLSNVEKCRAPLRCDLALRFCRELFVNEEWLATGALDLLNAVLLRSSRTIDVGRWEPIFFRTALDLRGEPVSAAIPHRALFSTAFTDHLKPVATELSKENWLHPSVHFSPYDRPEYRAEFLGVQVDRWRSIIRFRAEERGLPEQFQQHSEWSLVDDLTRAGRLIFYRSFGIETPWQSDPAFDFLRTLVADDKTPIGAFASSDEVVYLSRPKRRRKEK